MGGVTFGRRNGGCRVFPEVTRVMSSRRGEGLFVWMLRMACCYREHVGVGGCRGFTLVELLVVIGIISVLVGVLLPALSKARMSASRAVCASNVRQIGVGLLMYAGDHKGRLPESTHTAGGDFERTWVYSLSKYLGNVDKIRVSPADPKADERLEEKGTSYVLNEYFVVPRSESDPNDVDCLRLHKLRRSSEAFLVFVVSDQKGTTTTDDHTHSRNWFKAPWSGSWNRVCGDISPGRHGGKTWNGTRGSSNYLFGDGHVETISASDLKARVDRIAAAMDQRMNFARPPLP